LWSPGLDLWGTINLLTERLDEQWFFPESMFLKKRHDDLTQMCDILKKVSKNEFDILEEKPL
jgi:hypothetical protein